MPEKSQPQLAPSRVTVVSTDLSRLAPQAKRLFRGLERFANTGDSPEEYKSFAKAWPSYWPLDLQDGQAHSLTWDDACHELFLAYRDALRRVWISDPIALQGGTVSFLLGLSGWDIFLPDELGLRHRMALDRIKSVHRGVGEVSHLVAWPDWKTGDFSYSPDNDFRRAVYLLFRASWRAKVCAKCSTYFVAQKPAQMYCSVECSNAVHREAALKWWREKGAGDRAAKRKAKGSASTKRDRRRKQ